MISTIYSFLGLLVLGAAVLIVWGGFLGFLIGVIGVAVIIGSLIAAITFVRGFLGWVVGGAA